MEKEKLEEELNQFSGTAEYHKWSPLFSFVLTDGAKYLANTAKAYWLMDAIASHQHNKAVAKEEFQVWDLKKVGDAWELTCEDGNGKSVVKQDIEYSDFPLNSIKLYFSDGVILLPGEY
jgi:hypothetical protein